MLHIFVQISKFLLILLILLYTFECFAAFRVEARELRHSVYIRQRVLMYFIHALAFAVLYFTTMNAQMIGIYVLQCFLITAILALYHIFYKEANQIVLNNMCMLLIIGFIILTRLSYSKSLKQFFFCLAGLFICVIIPIIMQSVSIFRNLSWIYAIVGVLGLASVTILGRVEYGAKLSLSFGSFSIQPSEFVKILFVFFLASRLYDKKDFKNLLLTGICAAVFMMFLVAAKDLGGAFLYYTTFVIMIYVATERFLYLLGGGGLLAVAAFAGYHIFSHVQVRILAWLNPLSVYEKEGYQVSQSLFGIGTGGWFGLGLNQGLPNKIPIVEKDFVFAAISEELGGIFALCVIFICLSVFFMFMNIAIKMRDDFYKLIAIGLATIYALQVFLTIGGTIKFIPSTGVTLPLISYGGSSLLSTFIFFGIIQGLYVRNMTEEEKGTTDFDEKKTKRK